MKGDDKQTQGKTLYQRLQLEDSVITGPGKLSKAQFEAKLDSAIAAYFEEKTRIFDDMFREHAPKDEGTE